jgi:hypothetical protein
MDVESLAQLHKKKIIFFEINMLNILFCSISDASTVRLYKEDKVSYVKIKIFSDIFMSV